MHIYKLSQFVSICLNFAWFRWFISNFLKCKPLSPKWFIWFFLKLFLFNFGSIVFKFSQFCLEYFFQPTASAQKNNYWVSCAMQLFPKLFTIFGKPNCLLAVECNKFAILIESFRWVSESFATYIWSEILHKTFTTPLKVSCKHATNLRRTFIKIVSLLQKINQNASKTNQESCATRLKNKNISTWSTK